MPSNVPFVHLGARSEASSRESIARVEELCWEAARDEQGYLTLTDVCTLGRAPAFAAAAGRAGLKPVFGAELNVLPFGETQFRGTLFRVRVLVENVAGWRRLLSLVNHARQQEGPGRAPFTTMARLGEDPRGLLFFLAGERGELTALLRAGDVERVEASLAPTLEMLTPERVFFELPDMRLPGADDLARRVDQLARVAGVPLVAVPTIHCAHPNDEAVHRFLYGERNGGAPKRLAELVPPTGERTSLLSRAQVAFRYAAYPMAMAATLEIAQHCSAFVLPLQEKRFPIHDFCRGVDADSFVWNTAFAKATERYGDLPTRYKERLDREFKEIADAGLINAMVSLVRLREELEGAGVQRGPGAGLFTHSLVASLLGLTRLDPLRFDLQFDLPPGLTRGSFPLMEVSVPANQEADALTALRRLFTGQVVAVGTWQTWKPGTVMEALAERLGRDRKWGAHMARQNAFQKARTTAQQQPITWMPDPTASLESPEILGWMAHRMEGRAQVLRPAPGLYTFAVDPIEQCVPTRLARTAPGEEAIPLCEWSEEELGRLRHGRIRFNHPPLLDLIGEATAMAREQGELLYSPDSTASDDAATYRLLREGLTIGIEPLEAPTLRQALRLGQPQDLHGMIRLLLGDKAPRSAPDLASILLAHLCAAIKAHKPQAFFAAALSQAQGDTRRTAALLEEVHRRKIRIAPLDVNYCQWRWGVERDALRPGLMVVRSMTAAAGSEVLDKRRELHFVDLAEFIQRTDRSRLKPAQIRSLVRAGALDDLGESREKLLADFQILFPSTLAKKGSMVEDELSFFDRNADWWLRQHGSDAEATPAENAAEGEREAVGVPLQDALTLAQREYLRAASVKPLERLVAKDSGRLASIAGVLGLVESEGAGNSVVMADIGGCLVRAKGEPAERLEAETLAGKQVIATGILSREGTQWRLELESVAPLEEAIARSAESAELTLDFSRVAEANQKAVLEVLRQFPGRTPVTMRWLPADAPWVLRRIAGRRVLVSPRLEVALNRLMGEEHWELSLRPEGPMEARGLLARLLMRVPRWILRSV